MEVYLVLTRDLNIVITGTSRGVGYELTKKFLSKGNKVWDVPEVNQIFIKKIIFIQK